ASPAARGLSCVARQREPDPAPGFPAVCFIWCVRVGRGGGGGNGLAGPLGAASRRRAPRVESGRRAVVVARPPPLPRPPAEARPPRAPSIMDKRPHAFRATNHGAAVTSDTHAARPQTPERRGQAVVAGRVGARLPTDIGREMDTTSEHWLPLSEDEPPLAAGG